MNFFSQLIVISLFQAKGRTPGLVCERKSGIAVRGLAQPARLQAAPLQLEGEHEQHDVAHGDEEHGGVPRVRILQDPAPQAGAGYRASDGSANNIAVL